jgi:hypothetical protein
VLTAQSRIDAKNAGGKDKGLSGPSPFGTGKEGLQLQMISEFAPLYAAGSLLPQQERNFLMNVRDYTQERRTRYTDPLTGLEKVDIQRNELPDFVKQALGDKAPAPSTTTSASGAVSPAALKTGPIGLTASAANPEIFQIASTAPKSSFFDLAATGTGFVPVLVAGVARNVPLDAAGKIGPEFQQSTAMLQSMTNRVVNVLQENPRFAVAEQQQILKELKTAPRLFSNKNGYINQIIALDNVVEGLQKRQESVRDEPKTGVTARQEAIRKLEDIASIRELFGIQQRTITDPAVWKNLPPGEYIVIDPQTGFKVVQPKYSGPAGPTR